MKNLIYGILCMLALGTVSCFKDNTTLGAKNVGDIEIGKLSDATVVLFVGNHLKVTPEVKHGYSEEEMDYAWYLLGEKELGDHNYHSGKRIADTKALDLTVDNHEWNLAPGRYTLVFEAQASNAYTQTATMTLTASTEFSEGFYILKETADGNTELDLMTAEKYFPDLMSAKIGNALPGKPLNLAVVYDNGRINENDELEATNMVHVFAERDYHAFRTQDMLEIFNRENLMFDPLPEDEILYGMTSGCFDNICLSNKGYYEFPFGASSGKLGLPTIEGDMQGMQALVAGGYNGDVIFWNEQTQSLYSVKEKFDPEDCPLPAGFEHADLEYLASGFSKNTSTETAWFLCQDKNSGKRLLFQVKAELMLWGAYVMSAELSVLPVCVIDTDKHLAKSRIMSGVGLGKIGIYVVDEGKIYLYDLESGEEILVPLEGIEGEITYISNNYLNLKDMMGEEMEGAFNYLLVGTRDGEGYRLHIFDELVSGVPNKKTPKEVKKGKNGVVKHIRYCSNLINSDQWGGPFGSTTVYPYSD